uniref:Sidoreflexin n=1 Tax=Phallusia mammillata TaxID=59560 RepID=A0A6F9DSP2_9ASCI|nr:sideroflexin-2-like [Phallusia mammillata]
MLKTEVNKNPQQTTYFQRWRHFAAVTDVRNCFASNKQLEDAKATVISYRSGQLPPDYSEEKYLQAKQLYDSAYHPDTGEKMPLIGRMSFQVPAGMTMLGLLLQFYKTPVQVASIQFVNQSFISFVNYTNRNAASHTTTKQSLFAYVSATTTALCVAVGLNIYTRKAPPIFARWAPFAAISSASAVNIPLTRQDELLNGVVIKTEDGKIVGKSKKCARKGILQVFVSRMVMVAPGMTLIPILMEHLNKKQWFRKMPFIHLPFQMICIGTWMLVMLPSSCALFPQTASMLVSDLEPNVRESIENKYGNSVQYVYFNKGL